MQWHELPAALSGGVVALTALGAGLAWRDARQQLQGRILAWLATSVAALEVSTGPMGPALPEPLWFALRLAGGFNLGLLWLFCLAVLRDNFRMSAPQWTGFGLLCVGPFSTMATLPQTPLVAALNTAVSVAPFAAITHIVWVALSERRGDLVEGRLQARIWIPVTLLAAALISVTSEQLSDPELATLARTTGAALPAILAVLFWLVTMDPNRLRFETARSLPRETQVDPRDLALLASLKQAMDQGLYREPSLAIEKLAEKLNTPAHRLRALINQGLGHRNFAAFVNGYRLSHVRAALADPARGRETILAIAYEAGFGALQSFNRVFKEAEGVTPTEFREKRLAEAAQNQK